MAAATLPVLCSSISAETEPGNQVLPELVKEAFSDPSFLEQVRGLEAMLRVRARAVAPCVTSAARSVQQPSCDDVADGTDGVHSDAGVLRVHSGGAETAHAAAGASPGIICLLEGMESEVPLRRMRLQVKVKESLDL